MARANPPALVVGGGPVGMVAALVLARRRPVVLATGRGGGRAATRIDSLPIQSLAPLIELGIHPAEIGVEIAYDRAWSAWEAAAPAAHASHPKAHVDRGALGRALRRLVERQPRIRIEQGRPPDEFGLVVDASGRRAALSLAKAGASPAWIARTWTWQGAFSPDQAAFRIAAAPLGYAYRLGTGSRQTLGFVAPAGGGAGAAGFADSLKGAGGGWILDNLPPLAELPPGRGGPCSVQWAQAGEGRAIGDARFAPDALSAQGLAMGLAEALALDQPSSPVPPRRKRHVAMLRQHIARCRFRTACAWADYDRWLSDRQADAGEGA